MPAAVGHSHVRRRGQRGAQRFLRGLAWGMWGHWHPGGQEEPMEFSLPLQDGAGGTSLPGPLASGGTWGKGEVSSSHRQSTHQYAGGPLNLGAPC